ncbi:MAG: NAD-dependent epimerase/dehydratase family protein [Kofleriaceae bacterium]|nr:NAD-dependent epimerase/dehydratase family protein [Kofleriaceae bacterium]
MRFAITGATGFLGRALVLRLARDGHHVVALVRDPVAARGVLGAHPTVVALADDLAVTRAVHAADAIINLAGEGILERRWTAARKAALRASRVDRPAGWPTPSPPARARCRRWSRPARSAGTATAATSSSTRPRPPAPTSPPSCAATGRPPPRPRGRAASGSCGPASASSSAARAARWRRCGRCSAGAWAGRSGAAISGCRGSTSTTRSRRWCAARPTRRSTARSTWWRRRRSPTARWRPASVQRCTARRGCRRRGLACGSRSAPAPRWCWGGSGWSPPRCSGSASRGPGRRSTPRSPRRCAATPTRSSWPGPRRRCRPRPTSPRARRATR